MRGIIVMLVAMGLAGCVSEAPEAEPPDIRAVGNDNGRPVTIARWQMEDCLTLRMFLELDRDAVLAALPDGFALYDAFLPGEQVGGEYHVYRCADWNGTGQTVHWAFATASVIPERRPYDGDWPYDNYRFDTFVDNEELAAVLMDAGINVTLAAITIDELPGVTTYSIQADGIDWTGTFVRFDIQHAPDILFGIPFGTRWHSMEPGHVWMDLVEPQETNTGTIPDYGSATHEMQGGVTPTLMTPNQPIGIDMDWNSDLSWVTRMEVPVE